MRKITVFFILMSVFVLAGCVGHLKGNIGNMPVYRVPAVEAEWITAGQPLEFEGELWQPQDAFDILLDSEVSLLGEHQGVQVFIDRIDVRPYNTLYTKFDRNRFRLFKKKALE